MWGAPEEPPDGAEIAGPSKSLLDPSASVKEVCEDNKSQLETLKDIMLKSKKDLRKKEEELQEYASKLSEIKSRTKRTRRSKGSDSFSIETTPKSKADDELPDGDEDTVDDISQAKTPKAKSSLLQRKLAENRKIFERRSKEMTESKRAVEEKVEAIRQQMEQTELTTVESQRDPIIITPVRPVLITPQIISPTDIHAGQYQDKENKIAELSSRILDLEAMVIDLQDNLKEKDSVIDSKTKAITLMSADLSKKGKSTLDTLEDTKDEMRTMQENFVLIETSLRGKNENLLEQLQERNDRVTDLEATINRYEQEMEKKRLAETESANVSRTTMDTLADTKDEMRSMQENFVLIETSLREKNNNLLQQLEERETKLAEAEEKIYKLESGAGIVPPPEIPDLLYKIDRLEKSNSALQDEKYELQKSIADLQERIVSRESSNGNGLIVEKDNRIAELENLIEELKNSNQLLEEESKAELQKQVDELAAKNDEFRNKIDVLERLNNDLETEKNELRDKIPDESGITSEDSMVDKLKKELDDLNKSMIKLKAQHKSKLRNLQKQLESFKMVSDTNAELVKLGNQVALLEEEKGNLQLSLVDFDELKATAGDWQERIADLESRVLVQANDIQAHIEAIAILENQKLDLMQDLHVAKQEISALEAENAESENLRVTAEMKIVDMEEQLESLHKVQNADATLEPSVDKSNEELLGKIANLTQENSELVQRIAKLEEKPSSEAGSTESFETIHEDRNELMRKIEALSTRNAELEIKLAKLDEVSRSNIGSNESFETINDTDRSELVKKIDLLSRENSDLVTRLNKSEEKGSSDTGSTESFEKIPEHVDSSSRIEVLTRENNELVIKLTKLEEKMDNLIAKQTEEKVEAITNEDALKNDERLNNLIQENNDLVIEVTKLREKLSQAFDEKNTLQKLVDDAQRKNATADDVKSRIDFLSAENEDLMKKLVKLEQENVEIREKLNKIDKTEMENRENRKDEVESASTASVAALEAEIETCRKLITEQTELIDEMKTKLADKDAELEMKIKQISEYELTGISLESFQRELTESFGIIEEWKYKCETLERKMEILESSKMTIEEGLKCLQDENRVLIEETNKKDEAAEALRKELNDTIVNFANQFDEERAIAMKQEHEIAALQERLKIKEQELHDKYSLLQNEMINIDNLQEELNERRAQLEDYETIILTMKEEIQKLKAETIVSKEQVSMSQAEIVVLREELSTKASKEERNEKIINELKNMMNEQSIESTNLRTTMENTNVEVEHLRALLIEKNNEITSLVDEKSSLDDQIHDLTVAKNAVDSELESLQNSLDDNTKYAEDLKTELSNSYRMLELLKVKHTEDMEMLNRRSEDLIEDLHAKTSECEILRTELTEKTKLVEGLKAQTSELETRCDQFMEKEILAGQQVTEKMKIDLELRVKELEEKLLESEANTQTQLQKRKILAANLKKKSAQCEELEAKALELKTKADEFEVKVNELEPKASQLEVKANEFEARSSEFRAKIAELETKAFEFEAKLHELEPKSAEFEARIAELEPKAAEYQRKIRELEAYVTELEHKVVTFEAKAQQLEIKAAQFEENATRSDEKIIELESIVSTYEIKISELTAEATELEEKAAKFESEAVECQAKASIYEAQVHQLEPKTAALETKAAEFEAKAMEFEAKATDFEEKWISEKSEKDASNLKVQEYEHALREKNEMIIHLEDQLNTAQKETALSIEKAESLALELHSYVEKMSTVVPETRVTEMLDEIARLRSEIELRSSELENERIAKENMRAEFESRLQTSINEETTKQQILEEATERARELGVRMQVMESEYVDQLNTIQTLRTENGMLLSKQAQINERLENAEKEASERKILLDQMQRESIQRETEILCRNEVASEDEETRNDDKQSCDHCDQCQTVVQALEAKLQERDAEIENLDNELANSIGNFVHMRESLRVSDLMNQSTSRTRSHEESRETNDLVFQYNALTARNAELSDELNRKIRENEELREKIVSLEALNVALCERTGAVESELIVDRDATTDITEPSNDELRERLATRNNELENARSELETMRKRHDEWVESARSQIQQMELQNNELTETCNDLTTFRNEAEAEIASLREESTRCQRKFIELQEEVDKYRQEATGLVEDDSRSRKTRGASSFFIDDKDEGPQLFDAAKLFGPSPTSDSAAQRELSDLRDTLATKDLEKNSLSREVKRLAEQIVSLESHERESNARNAQEIAIARENCQRLDIELVHLQQLLEEKNRQIQSLNLELNNVGAQLAEQFNHQGHNDAIEKTLERLKLDNEECVRKLVNAESTIEKMSAENVELVGKLENLQLDNDNRVKIIDLVSAILNAIPEDFHDIESPTLAELKVLSPALHFKLVDIINHRNDTKNERNQLVDSLESRERKISLLEEELKSSNDSTKIQELEERIGQIIRERDLKQLHINDLTRSLEEMQEAMENASSNDEIRLRNLQASLERALNDNEQLKIQSNLLSRENDPANFEQTQHLKVCEEMKKSESERLKIHETDELQTMEPLESETSRVSVSDWDEEPKMDDEMWSWNAADAQLAEGHCSSARDTLLPNLERRLNARIAELEDTIHDLENERSKLTEEIQTTQLRSGKLVKKLKEFKIQNESLQQQLKIQKATVDFCGLDTAIEEELKSQIKSLEKALDETKEETRKSNLERDNLLKRIDVLAAANERLVEMKERQDMEVEVLQIRTKDLSNKLESMEWQFRESCDDESKEENRSNRPSSIDERVLVKHTETLESGAAPANIDCLCKQYKAEIEELRDEMEALAAENEQLQKLLEEQRTMRLSIESKLNDGLSESAKEIEQLSRRNSEIYKELDDTRNHYRSLKDQYDRDTKNSEQQIILVKQTHDILKSEIAQKTQNFESEIAKWRDEMNSANLEIDRLQEKLRLLIVEREGLIERAKTHDETIERLAGLQDSMTELTDLLNSRVQEVAELKREIQRLKADNNEALVTAEDLAQNHTREMSMKNEETHRYVFECETRLKEQNIEIADLRERLSNTEVERLACCVNVDNMRQEIERLNEELIHIKTHREALQSELANKERELFRAEDEVRKYVLEVKRLDETLVHLSKSSAETIDEANRRIREIEDRESYLNRTINEFTVKESEAVAQFYREISEKDNQVTELQQTIANLEQKIHDLIANAVSEKIQNDFSRVQMTTDEIRELRSTIETLEEKLSRKNEEIEDYKYQLSESTYPSIIQALQDQVNALYEEKAKIERSLAAALEDLSKERELRAELTGSSEHQSRQLQSTIEENLYETRRETRRNDEMFNIRKAEDEIRALKMEIDERIMRFNDLHDRYENAEIEINDLRLHLATKEQEIATLQQRLESTRKECELVRNALKIETPRRESERFQKDENSPTNEAAKEQSSNELDFALYMLHQRDVRCEELTHELMQLLGERDSLQLRLSNAIRVNEELRKSLPIESRSSEIISEHSDSEPLVEQPSPSRSVGPVEIAKEAIDTPTEDKIALAEKLSQLHNTGHRRDIRLMDDRELRHNQQMSLLAHRDVLSTLPPEAAARFVNANYTLSRDVQSQSSVLMNWLWGKSTPKVVHM